jgi:hypothetical protein
MPRQIKKLREYLKYIFLKSYFISLEVELHIDGLLALQRGNIVHIAEIYDYLYPDEVVSGGICGVVSIVVCSIVENMVCGVVGCLVPCAGGSIVEIIVCVVISVAWTKNPPPSIVDWARSTEGGSSPEQQSICIGGPV